MGSASLMFRGLAAAIAGIVAVVVGLLVAVIIVASLLAQTDFGRRTLASALEGVLSAPGAEVAIGQIGRGLPARLAVEDVAIRDEEGVWLTVDRAIVNWRPSALLWARLHVEDISADGIRLARLPPADEEAEPAAPGEPVEVPSLPVDVRIDSIAIRGVTLGEMIVGERMTLDITGQVSAPAEQAFRTRLRVERTDQRGLLATLDAELDPATNALWVDADVTEPEGGLIARLAGLEPYPPIAMNLEGKGPLSDWQGRLTATAGELVDLEVAIGLARTEALSLSLSGIAEVPGLVEAPLRAIVEDAVHFDVLVSGTAEDRYRIDRMVLRSDAMEAGATGTVDLGEQRLDISLSVASRDARRLDAAFETMTVGQIELSAAVSGALALPEVSLSGSISDVDVAAVGSARTVNLQAHVEPHGGRGSAAESVSVVITLDATGIETDDSSLAGLTGDTLSADARGLLDMSTMVLTIEKAVLASGPSLFSAEGWMNLDSGDIDATVETSIGDLSALGEAVDQQLSGAIEVTAHVEGNAQTLVLRDGTIDAVSYTHLTLPTTPYV